MQPESPALLWDARRAAGLITEFVVNRSWEEYQRDPMLRRVERQFRIIDDALNRLSRLDPATAVQVIPAAIPTVGGPALSLAPTRRLRVCTKPASTRQGPRTITVRGSLVPPVCPGCSLLSGWGCSSWMRWRYGTAGRCPRR